MTYWAIQKDRALFEKSIHPDAVVSIGRWRRFGQGGKTCLVEYEYRVKEIDTGRDWGWTFSEYVPCHWAEHPLFVNEGHFVVDEDADQKALFAELLKRKQKIERIFGPGSAWR